VGHGFYRLIAKGTFEPEEIEVMTAAYEAALVDLGLVDRNDPITEIVATAIVGITAELGGRGMSFNICRGTLGSLAMFTAKRNASSRVVECA
jgi:hypothetical protein